jgi:hypothetical protein
LAAKEPLHWGSRTSRQPYVFQGNRKAIGERYARSFLKINNVNHE